MSRFRHLLCSGEEVTIALCMSLENGHKEQNLNEEMEQTSYTERISGPFPR